MKWRYLILALFAVGFVSSTTQAEEGLELGGNVTTFFGWQKNDSNALGTTIGAIPERGVGTANRDTFNFYLDEVELNLQKSWGDKVRIRADLDFGSAALGSNFSDFAAATAFVLEQGYIGFNILDAEIIVGRFNVPIGVYSVDRINNVTISYPTVFGLLPSNGTGVKLFWGINDSFDMQLYVVNNIADTVSTAAGGGLGGIIPSGGFRLGYNWGDEDHRSTVGLSGYAGGQLPALMKHLTFMGDIDLSWYVTEQLLIQAEGAYRQDNKVGAGKNNKAYSGFLTLDYLINDSWDVYGSYGYIHDWEGNLSAAGAGGFYTGADQQVHSGTVGVGYNITDGAKFRLEYRLDYQLPAGAASNALTHAAVGSFSYAF
ncbi:MAG: outer membrane beta-barrel protein [Deltaproteobacteria bacterium]|nr:outer membrane beta-barrel protein [Deltaproteobacteria bacterium]